MEKSNVKTYRNTPISLHLDTHVDRAKTQTTTSSTHSFHKKSIKKLLQNKHTLKGRGEVSMNLNFNDIKAKTKTQIIEKQLEKLQCYKIVTIKKKCPCFEGKRCQLVDKWTLMSHGFNKKGYWPIDAKIVKQIDLDLQRTNNSIQNMSHQDFREIIRKTLTTYCSIDPEVNYIQGFNYLAAAITIHTRNLHDSIHIFTLIMRDRKYRQSYLSDFAVIREHSKKIVDLIKGKIWALHLHFVKLGLSLQIYIIGWLIPMFSNIVPQSLMHMVIDGYITRGWAYLYSLTLTLFLYLRQQILQMLYAEDIQLFLSVQHLQNHNIHWQTLLQTTLNFPIYPIDIQITKNKSPSISKISSFIG